MLDNLLSNKSKEKLIKEINRPFWKDFLFLVIISVIIDFFTNLFGIFNEKDTFTIVYHILIDYVLNNLLIIIIFRKIIKFLLKNN